MNLQGCCAGRLTHRKLRKDLQAIAQKARQARQAKTQPLWPASPIRIAQAKHHATTPASLRAENPQSEIQQSLEASAKEILQARTQQSLQAKAQEIPWGRACKNLFKPAWDMAEARVKPACSKDSVQAGPQHSLPEMPTTLQVHR